MRGTDLDYPLDLSSNGSSCACIVVLFRLLCFCLAFPYCIGVGRILLVYLVIHDILPHQLQGAWQLASPIFWRFHNSWSEKNRLVELWQLVIFPFS
ncbi:hypothetical protein BDV09DRAFT_181878 [Aspergillus tetrazonus]